MAHPAANPPRLTAPPADLAELRAQWSTARRGDVWALLAALERARIPHTLHHDPAWTFAPGDLRGDSLADGTTSVAVHTTFLGLLGVDTPLPQYAVDAIDEAPQLRRLIDAVQHRVLALLHRAVQRCAYPATLGPARDDPTSRRLVDIIAAGVDGPELPPRAWLRMLRWSPARLRTASGLASALSHLFAAELGNATLAVGECIPHTSDLPESARTRLGRPSTALGQRFVLGDRAPDGDGWFRVRVATVPAARARGFFRGGDALRRLFTAVAALAGPLLRFDVEVVFAPGATPRMHLGEPQPSRLGVDTWLIHLHHGPHTVRHDDPG